MGLQGSMYAKKSKTSHKLAVPKLAAGPYPDVIDGVSYTWISCHLGSRVKLRRVIPKAIAPTSAISLLPRLP